MEQDSIGSCNGEETLEYNTLKIRIFRIGDLMYKNKDSRKINFEKMELVHMASSKNKKIIIIIEQSS